MNVEDFRKSELSPSEKTIDNLINWEPKKKNSNPYYAQKYNF